MDITDTLAPKSEQLDAVDLAATGPQTFTITRVDVKDSEQQPANIYLAEFPRPWRPNLNTRRILGQAWGKSDGGAYEGRRVTLFYDPNVEFGGSRVGGVRISHMSHLPGGRPFSALILPKKGRSETVVIQPLTDPAPKPARKAVDVATMTDRDALRAMWRDASPEIREQITARVAELDAAPTFDDEAWIGGEPA